MTVRDIYRMLDDAAPFALQESYDNSGLLCGDPAQPVHRILLTLDITLSVAHEAVEKGADLILSHHPVIWDPIKALTPVHPIYHLTKNGIAAICSHTCLDIAEGGLNDFVGDLLAEEIAMTRDRSPLVQLSGGRTLGRTAALLCPCDADTLADRLCAVFHCAPLRYYDGSQREIRRIAWCTGSGGDLIADAITAGADALITGDCKHSIWAEAQNRGFTLFDCGHFETEVPVVRLFTEILQSCTSEVELLVSTEGTKPFFSAKIAQI